MRSKLFSGLVVAPLALGLVLTWNAAAQHPEGEPGAAPEHAVAAEHGAAAEHGGAGEHEAHDTPSVILHHVSDSNDYVFELPFGDGTGDPTLHLGTLFAGLQFEGTPGACSAAVPGAWSAFPSLFSFMNGCYDFRPTKAFMMMWISVVLLVLTMLVGVNKDPQKLVPRGVAANLIEVLVLFIRDEIAVKNIGKEAAAKYTPFLCTAFFFILYMNWLGLIPNFGSATGSISVTAALALCTFVLTQIAAIRSAGVGGFLAHLTAGTPWPLWPIMIPVEILGLFTKPFALTIRLFANMLAGHMVLFFVLGLIFLIHPLAAVISVPMATALYFLEIFVGLLQAYIFTMLSALFIGLSVSMGHHGHEEHAHADTAHAH